LVTEKKYVGKMMRILSNMVHRKIENELSRKAIKVTGTQARIIGFIYRNSNTGNVYQKDIEAEFDIRRSTATNILQLLEKNGYITRVSVEEDARLKKIQLTEKGNGVYEEVKEVIQKVEGEFSSIYSEEELETLFYLLEKLRNTLEE
jgi:DNA-binding MarR family transcriptional regulator